MNGITLLSERKNNGVEVHTLIKQLESCDDIVGTDVSHICP